MNGSGAPETDCCIVGGGPAGAFLGYLLARRGIRVVLLEAQKDFEREFRGDTLHASVLEILEQAGLADKLLRLPHRRARTTTYVTARGTFVVSDYSALRTKYPFVTLIPQSRFLEFITGEARRFANFTLMLGANAQGLLEDAGAVRGVLYRDERGDHALRATLTVAADGRASRLRRLAGLEPVATAPPMDVLWFRLPRAPKDPEQDSLSSHFGTGYFVCLLDRGEYWQASYVIRKGAYAEIRAAGLESFRSSIAALLPMFRDRLGTLQDWSQIALLSTGTSRLKDWHRPGLLFIGDAAHVMSTVGGVGINCAIHDAVEAANVLAGPLATGSLTTRHLAAVQRRREWPTRLMQGIQAMTQKTVVAKALTPGRTYQVPLWLRLPLMRRLSAYLIAYGLRPARIADPWPGEPAAAAPILLRSRGEGSLRVSVVVPCRDAAQTIGECLRSLKRQSYPAHEIIVVDDGSVDGSADVVSRQDVILIRRRQSGGAGAARSEGAARASGDIIAFLDSDCWAPYDWLSRIAGTFEADPLLGGIGGKYTHLPATSLMGDLIRCEEEYIHYVFSQHADDVNPPGGHSAYRRELWNNGRSKRELQLFQGIASGEDTVVGNELRAIQKLKYDYSLEVFHHQCQTSRYFRRHVNRGISRSTIELNALTYPGESSVVLKAHGGWPLFLGSLMLLPAALSLPLWFVSKPAAAATAALSLALHFALSREFFGFVRRLHAESPGSPSLPWTWRLAFRPLLTLRSLCWIYGAATGFCRHLRLKAGAPWNAGFL